MWAGLQRIGSAALLSIAIAVVVQGISLSFQAHSFLPELDEWYSLSLYQSLLADGHFLQKMFSQHNEHRIFFPRLILFADYWFFKGAGLFDIGVIVLIQGLHAALFIFLIAGSRYKTAIGAALGSVVFILLFSLRQSENFSWGFQVSFVGVFSSASLAATLLAHALAPRWNGRRSLALTIGAFAAATIASFSMTNGMLSGIVLLVLAALARAPGKLVLTIIVWLLIVYVTFLHNYHLGEDHESLASLLHRPTGLTVYAAAYLGNFLDDEIIPAIFMGLVGLVALAAATCRAALRRDPDPAHLALIGIALFAAGSAFVTALGRSVDGIGGAMSSRYATGSATFSCAMLVLAWSLAREWRWAGVAIRLSVGVAAAILVGMAVREQAEDASFMRDQRYSYNLHEDAFLLDLYDKPHFEALGQPMDRARLLVPWLRQNGLSIFAGHDAGLLGRPLAEAGPVSRTPCSGAFIAAIADPALGLNGVRVRGWAPMKQAYGASNRVYLVDAERTIVGFASTPFGANAWTGYAKAALGSAVSAFALDRTGLWCDSGRQTVAARSDAS